jgi:hypothetical protein
MNRLVVSIFVATIAGSVAVCLLPPPWLAPLSAVAAICAAIFAFIVRINTKTQQPSANPEASALLSLANLPEQPLAKVRKGWALTMFLTSAAFLISLCLAVIVRANT